MNEPYVKPGMHTFLSTLADLSHSTITFGERRFHFCPQRVLIRSVRKEATRFAKITLQAGGEITRQPRTRVGGMILGLEKRREKKGNQWAGMEKRDVGM